MNRLDISELYECIINDNYRSFPEFEKYNYYFELFFNNYNRDLSALNELVELLELYNKDMDKLSREFMMGLKVQDQIQLGFATNAPIYALGLLFDKSRYPFNYDYYRYFKVLFGATEKIRKKSLQGINKYRDIYETIIDYDSFESSKKIDQDNYHNFQFNYHMLVNYAFSYAYYMNYEPERVKRIIEYFVKNYEQIINNFDVNGLTREDLVISKQGLNYYIDFYKMNNQKQELKVIK